MEDRLLEGLDDPGGQGCRSPDGSGTGRRLRCGGFPFPAYGRQPGLVRFPGILFTYHTECLALDLEQGTAACRACLREHLSSRQEMPGHDLILACHGGSFPRWKQFGPPPLSNFPNREGYRSGFSSPPGIGLPHFHRGPEPGRNPRTREAFMDFGPIRGFFIPDKLG